MDTYEFHMNEKNLKDVLTNERYTDEVIVDSMRANFEISNDFNTLDIQSDIIKLMGLDKQFDRLQECWEYYDRRFGEGQQEFKNLDEFADALKYCDLTTQKSVTQGFGRSMAVAIRNNKLTQENVLKLKCIASEKYLKQLETEGDDTAFEEFCGVLDIDYDNMSEVQIDILHKFFTNTMLYAEKLVKREELDFLKRYIPYITDLENRVKGKFCISTEELKNMIERFNPRANVHKFFDDLTNKYYYAVDISGQMKFKTDKDIMNAILKGIGPIMFLGEVSDKINVVTGKTHVDDNNPRYTLDINMMSADYMSFYLPFFNYFLSGVSFRDYKGYVNDMLEIGPLFVGWSDLNKYVNNDLLEDMKKDKIAIKVGLLHKNDEKLDKYLKNQALKYRKQIDKIYQKTVEQTKKYSGFVTKHKPEQVIPFAEF